MMHTRTGIRLPNEALELLDLLKPDYPLIRGVPSRSSVILSLLAKAPVQTVEQAQAWSDLIDLLHREGMGDVIR